MSPYVINRVHGNTTSLGPAVPLCGKLVLSARCLEHRLVCPSTTSNNTNHTAHCALDDLLGTTGELDSRLALVRVVADDGHVVARSSAQRTPVTHLLLDIGDDGTFGNGAKREDVSNVERSVLAGVDELTSVHAFVGDEGLGVELVAVGITESDLGEGCTTAGVVDDLLHDTTDVTMALGVVESSELCGCFVEAGAGGAC